VGEKSPQDDVNKLEDTVKKALDGFSGTESATDTDLSSLEDVVQGALTELTDLENNLLEVISPSAGSQADKDSNYLLAVRRLQNAMKVALLDGARKKDFKTFEEGFNFYNNALEIITATGIQSEIDQVMSEFAQTLIKIITKPENIKNPEFKPFAFKACKNLAEIYDYFKNFEISGKFHNRAGDLTSDNPLIAELEYFQSVIDYILLNDLNKANEQSAKLKFKHIVIFANDLTNALNESKPELIEQIKTKIEVLAAQKGFKSNNILFLLNLIKERIKDSSGKVAAQTIKAPSDVVPLSKEKIEAIKDSLTKGIQSLQEAYPELQNPAVAQIDTSEIISELKEVISTEISKEVKSLSSDIVSKILSNLPRGGGMASGPRYAGTISDADRPDIEIVEGGPREKPQRPKLDDMLDSVIVSE